MPGEPAVYGILTGKEHVDSQNLFSRLLWKYTISEDILFIHSFIYLLNKTIVKSAVKCTVDCKDKALTAAQKLKLHKNYISNRN